MANNHLSEWLKQGLQKGYSLNELKERALKHGYSEKEVNDAIAKIKKPEARIKKSPALKTFAFIVLIGLIAAAIYLFINFNPSLPRPSGNETSPKEELPMPDEEWMNKCMNMSQFPENTREEICKGYFYYYLAMNENNSKYCEEIKADEAQRYTCLENLK